LAHQPDLPQALEVTSDQIGWLPLTTAVAFTGL